MGGGKERPRQFDDGVGIPRPAKPRGSSFTMAPAYGGAPASTPTGSGEPWRLRVRLLLPLSQSATAAAHRIDEALMALHRAMYDAEQLAASPAPARSATPAQRAKEIAERLVPAERAADEATAAGALDSLAELGPGWQLSMSDPGGWPDENRWWCWLPDELGGDGDTFMGRTPAEAIQKAAKALGDELTRGKYEDDRE